MRTCGFRPDCGNGEEYNTLKVSFSLTFFRVCPGTKTRMSYSWLASIVGLFPCLHEKKM